MAFPVIITAIIYISIIILCTVAATLYVSRLIQRGEPISKALSVMTIAMTLYTVFEMITGLFDELISSTVYVCVIIASDIAYFAVVGAWLIMTILLTGNPYVVKIKGLVCFIAIYAVVVEPLGIIKNAGFFLGISYNTAQSIITGINLVFDLTIFVLAFCCLIYGLRKMDENNHRIWVIWLSGMLALYMVYICWWDTMGSIVDQGDLGRYKYFDPILLVYALVCILIIWLLVRRGNSPIGFDISKTIGINKDNAEYWKKISKKYRLTMREIETVQMVVTGKSNNDIAGSLFISENTVKHHLNSIYKKTGTKNRYELMNLANMEKN